MQSSRVLSSNRGFLIVATSLSLAGLIWFVFGQTLGHGFINFDDPDYVTKNRPVTAGVTANSIAWAFTHTHAANWHPLTWISHMADCEFYGLAPRGHHLTNVLLHTATAILLFLVLTRMTGALWRSAFVAAVFAIHPLRAESVAWIAERKDVLSGFFFMLTIAAYVRYARAPSSLRYGILLLSFAAGLMSKPMLVTLPLVLLLLDYWPLTRLDFAALSRAGNRHILTEKLPLFVMSGASCLVTILAQKQAWEVTHVPLWIRAGNAIVSYGDYIWQTLWPVNLAAFYPFPPNGVSVASLLVAALSLIAICALVYAFRARRYLVTGWVWYLVTLVPVIGILQPGAQAHADRYTYLPQIGLLIAITWTVGDLSERWRALRVACAPVAAVLLGALAFVGRADVAVWHDSETLWAHALAVTRENGPARGNLAHALQEQGRLDEAVTQYRRSLQLDAAQARVHTGLAATLLNMGQTAEAVQRLQQAIELNPNLAEAHSNLGLALLQSGRSEEAIAHFSHALALDPEFADAHYNLANAMVSLGRDKEAKEHYTAAIALNPADVEASNNLAWLLATSPDGEVRDGRKAIELADQVNRVTAGHNPTATVTVAAAYAEAGEFEHAIKVAEEGLQIAVGANDQRTAQFFRAHLPRYRAHLPWRDERGVAR